MLKLDNKEKIINKVKRFSLVVTLRRVMPFIAIIGVFFLTCVLGVWNIKNIEYPADQLKYIEDNQLEEIVSIFRGKNIFLLDVNKMEEVVEEKSLFIKSIEIEKVIPNKLRLIIKEYIPQYAFIFNNKCNLYAQEGIKVSELCENCSNECKDLSEQWNSIYIESSDSLEGNGVFMYYTEIGKIIRVLSEFGYVIKGIKIEDGITTLYDNKHEFIFDLNDNLDTQLARLYLVGKKINSDNIIFKNLDLRFDRPVLKNE